MSILFGKHYSFFAKVFITVFSKKQISFISSRILISNRRNCFAKNRSITLRIRAFTLRTTFTCNQLRSVVKILYIPISAQKAVKSVLTVLKAGGRFYTRADDEYRYVQVAMTIRALQRNNGKINTLRYTAFTRGSYSSPVSYPFSSQHWA